VSSKQLNDTQIWPRIGTMSTLQVRRLCPEDWERNCNFSRPHHEIRLLAAADGGTTSTRGSDFATKGSGLVASHPPGCPPETFSYWEEATIIKTKLTKFRDKFRGRRRDPPIAPERSPPSSMTDVEDDDDD
jgi:hypothetical protein